MQRSKTSYFQEKCIAQETENNAYQNEVNILQRRLEPLEETLDLIYVAELSTFLPRQKRPDRFRRNKAIHGAQVQWDLNFLRSPSKTGQKFLENNKLTNSDMIKAFRTRYKYSPYTLGDPSTIPDAISGAINMRTDLEHLTFWEEDPNSDDDKFYYDLVTDCKLLVRNWLHPTKEHPYSPEATQKSFEDLKHRYWSMYREYSKSGDN